MPHRRPLTPDEIAARLAPFRPEREGDLVVEQLTSEPDGFGRTEFLLHWLGHGPAPSGRGFEFGHRAQIFHAQLDRHVERWLADHPGATVRIVAPPVDAGPTPC